MGFRQDINFLRAVAVLAVVLFHFQIKPFSSGFVGVDIFFVISGYLMTGIIISRQQKNNFSLMRFYQERALRIIPALACLALVILLYGWFCLNPIDFKKTALSASSALGFVSNILFWRTTNYFNDNHDELLLHTWSLSVEWQFYLLYPLLIALLAKLKFGKSAIRNLLLIVAAISFFLTVFVATYSVSTGFYLLPTRMWEMIVGGLVFLHGPAHLSPRVTARLFFICLFILLLCTAYIPISAPWPSAWTLLPVGATAAIIFLKYENSRLIAYPPIMTIGYWSYSIYLWHWPLLLLARRWFPEAWGLYDLLIPLLFTLVFSYLSYRFIEASGRRKITQPGWSLLGLFYGGLISAVICAGLLIWFFDGVLTRGAASPKSYRQIIEAKSDWEYPVSCGYKAKGRSLVLCSVGVPEAERRVLFLGDSHAEQWYARYKFLAAKNTNLYVAFATYGGCPPIIGVNRLQAGFACESFNNDVLKLVESGKWNAIVVEAFWPGYFLGRHDDEIHPLLCRSKENTCLGPGLTLNHDLAFLRSSLMIELTHLRRGAREVSLVLSAPFSDSDLVDDKLNDDFFGRPFAMKAGINLIEFKERTAELNKLLRDAAQGVGVQVIDPTLTVCINGWCPVLDKNEHLIFRDGNHYRASFVKDGPTFLDDAILGR